MTLGLQVVQNHLLPHDVQTRSDVPQDTVWISLASVTLFLTVVMGRMKATPLAQATTGIKKQILVTDATQRNVC